MNEVERSLTDEIIAELVDLKGMEVGTDSYKTTVDGITKLMDRAVEMRKLDLDAQEQEQKREDARVQAALDRELKQQQIDDAKAQAEDEKTLRLKQMEEDRIDRLVRNILTGVSIGTGVVLTVWGTNKTLKFEETGSITTSAGRKFINKVFSWMK